MARWPSYHQQLYIRGFQTLQIETGISMHWNSNINVLNKGSSVFSVTKRVLKPCCTKPTGIMRAKGRKSGASSCFFVIGTCRKSTIRFHRCGRQTEQTLRFLLPTKEWSKKSFTTSPTSSKLSAIVHTGVGTMSLYLARIHELVAKRHACDKPT